jgi:hypothetical protein
MEHLESILKAIHASSLNVSIACMMGGHTFFVGKINFAATTQKCINWLLMLLIAGNLTIAGNYLLGRKYSVNTLSCDTINVPSREAIKSKNKVLDIYEEFGTKLLEIVQRDETSHILLTTICVGI